MAEQGPNPHIDRLLSNVQTRRQEAKAQKNPSVTTERGMTEGTQIEVPQSPTARLMLKSIDDTMADIKSDPRMKIDLLPAYAQEAGRLREGVNKLDYQYHTNSIDVPVKLDNGKTQFIRVTELDLDRPPVGKEDARIPYVGIGGAGSITEQNTALWYAMALEGKRVQVLSFPEQNQGRMVEGRSLLDKFKNTRGLQMESFKKTLQHLNHDQMNLVGHSIGAAEVIELAADPDFAGKVNDIISLAPIGFEKQHFLSLGKRFMDQGGITQKDPESKVMMLEQGNVDAAVSSKVGLIDFVGLGRVAAQHTITEGVLDKALGNISGELQVWAGDKDTVSRPQAIHGALKEFVAKHPDQTDRVASYTVQGGHHDFLVTNGLGLVSAIDNEAANRVKGASYIDKKVDASTIARSGSEWVLGRMRASVK